MRNSWYFIKAKIDGLNLRERVLVWFTIAILVTLASGTLIIDPFLSAKTQAQNELDSASKERTKTDNQYKKIKSDLSQDKNTALLIRIQQITQQVNQLNQQLGINLDLIPAQEMADVLQKILAEQGNKLSLVQLESLPSTTLDNLGSPASEKSSEPIFGKTSENTSTRQTEINKSQTQLYLQGTSIVLEGTFVDTLDYLDRLEKLPWKFIWDKLDYEVVAYPKAKISLTLYTLSTESNWIGI